MIWLKTYLKRKAFALTVNKGQKELLELFMANKPAFEEWLGQHPQPRIRFQFYFPTAVDFYYSDFKLFTAYFHRNRDEQLELVELKMSETNFDTIRSASWAPFEEIMIAFLTTLEENRKIELFEKRRMLHEYESLCAKNLAPENAAQPYLRAVAASAVPSLKAT